MMGPFGTNPVHIDSQGNHVEPPLGIEERIAEVLREHRVQYEYVPLQQSAWWCKCGWAGDTEGDADAHVAVVVAQALHVSVGLGYASVRFDGDRWPSTVARDAIEPVSDTDKGEQQ